MGQLAFGMVGKEDIVIIFLMVWVAYLVPFAPNKKSVIYNGSKKTRVLCCITGITGMISMLFYELCYQQLKFEFIIECVFQAVSVIFIVCSILCYKEFLQKKDSSIIFKIISVLSGVLIVMAVVWLVLYWVKIFEFDIYLFLAPQIGAIMLSAYGSKDYGSNKDAKICRR